VVSTDIAYYSGATRRQPGREQRDDHGTYDRPHGGGVYRLRLRRRGVDDQPDGVVFSRDHFQLRVLLQPVQPRARDVDQGYRHSDREPDGDLQRHGQRFWRPFQRLSKERSNQDLC